MYDLPTSITIDGVEHKIRNNGDYRVVLDVISACQDNDLNSTEQAVASLIMFYEDINCYEDIFLQFNDIEQAVKAMENFLSCNESEIGHTATVKLIDWEQDENLIVSAINNVARTEIRALPYLHWWTFISYYMAIGECSLSTIIGIRDKISRGKKLEKYEQEFRRKNPEYFVWRKQSQTDKQAEELIDSLWNND